MAASKRFLLAKSTQRRQATLMTRAESRNMPSVIKPSIWERARNAYFNDRPFTHAQRLENQMAQKGVE